MGWRAYTKDGNVLVEDVDGRPVQLGEEGQLLAITQEDFGRKVAVDLVNGIIYFDYDGDIGIQNGTIEINNPKFRFFICEETNIIGGLFHLRQEFVYLPDENGRHIRGADGQKVKVRNDIMTPLIWRPIWFTRWTNGMPTKVIGAQTTTPIENGARNIKKMISIFGNGDIGID